MRLVGSPKITPRRLQHRNRERSALSVLACSQPCRALRVAKDVLTGDFVQVIVAADHSSRAGFTRRA